MHLANHLAHGASFNLFHREIMTPILQAAELVDRHNTRMLQLRSDLSLFHETSTRFRRQHQLRPQHLRGHRASQIAVAHSVNEASSTMPDNTEI